MYYLERATGLEPATSSLGSREPRCSYGSSRFLDVLPSEGSQRGETHYCDN